MKHTKALLIFSTILTVTFGTVMPRTVQPVKDWTVLIFIEGRNNLNNFAKKNIREMLNVGSNKRLNILTQWYQPGRTKEAWRYKIERSKIVTCGTVPARSNGKSQHKKDLVDAMRWAVTTHPAKHYALVLWDHGLGIIDPKWKQGQLLWGTGASVVTTEEDEFEQDLDAVSCSLDNPRTQIDGITSCFSAEHRGILFNERDRTYMNNQDLVAALHTIKHDVLKGENIDYCM